MASKLSLSSPRAQSLWASILLIVVVTGAIYWPVVHQGFFNWDDPKHVRAIWKPGWERAWRIVTDFDLRYTEVAYYVPLHFLSLMADQALLGNVDQPQAWIAKVVNVGYHAANATLVFILLLALGTGRTSALLAALIFAAHPIQVGTVAWVVERKNVLSAFFYLAGVVAFLKVIRTQRLGYGIGVLLLFAAGLLSKPSVVTLPVVMLATLALFEDRKSLGKGPYVLVGGTFLLALAWSAYVMSTEVSYRGILPPWYMRPLLGAGVIWFYISKFLCPHALVVIYPRWDVPGHAWEFLFLFGMLAVLVAVVAYAYWRGRLGAVTLWGFVFFLINTLPVSGLAPFGYMGHSFVADHLVYLALVGPAAVVAGGANAALSRIGPDSVRSMAFRVGACTVVAILALLSMRQVRLWQDPALLWETALKLNKGSTALYVNYADVCANRGQLEKALTLFQRAAELSPRFDASYNNMGRILMALGRTDEARKMFETSLHVNPQGIMPRLMIAKMLDQERKPTESLRFLQESVAEYPGSAALRTQLAEQYRSLGKEKQALRELDRAILLDPLAAAPYSTKAYVLLSQGQTTAAIALLHKALSLGTDPDAHNMLGAAFAAQGNVPRALEEFLKAYALRPNLAGVRDNIANALMDMNEYRRAREFCSKSQKSGFPCSTETLARLKKNDPQSP